MLYAAPVEGGIRHPKIKKERKPRVKKDATEAPKKPRKQATPKQIKPKVELTSAESEIKQAEPVIEPVAEPVAEPVTEPVRDPVAVIEKETPKPKRKGDDEPPSWFVTFIKNTQKQEAKLKKTTKKEPQESAQEIARETWDNDYKRQRIEQQTNHHMKQMHSLYNQMFYR